MEYQLLNRSILFLWAIPRITFQVARPVIPVDRLAAPLDWWLRWFVCSLSQSHFTAADISSTVPRGSKDSPRRTAPSQLNSLLQEPSCSYICMPVLCARVIVGRHLESIAVMIRLPLPIILHLPAVTYAYPSLSKGKQSISISWDDNSSPPSSHLAYITPTPLLTFS